MSMLTRIADGLYELVASFANRPNLLKYEAKTHACATETPLERMGKTCGAPAHAILHTGTACHAFF
jgi:hypothetical protein